jgi:hypothetical protein
MSHLLAGDALLDLLEHGLHLLSDEVLDLGLKVLELASDAVGVAASRLLSLLEVILNLGERGDGDAELGLFLVLLSSLLDSVATLLNNLSVVGRTTTVPGEDVLGVAWDVRESTDGSDGDEVSLELLGGDVCDSVGRVLGRLERQHVGKETSNVGRGHGGTRDGVGGVLRADPGGKDVETRGEDVVALSVVGEVRTLVKEGGGTDGDSVLSSSWGVVAGVGVVVTGSNGKVDTSVNSGVDSKVKGGGLATSQAHVGSAALEALLLTVLGSLDGVRVRLSSVLDTLDDVGHGARAVGAEHLDGVDVRLLGDTVLLTSNSAGAVGAVAVAILVGIAVGDGLAPLGTTLKVDVLSVCASVDDVNVNTLTTVGGVEVLVPGAEAQGVAVRDTSKTPWGVLLDLRFVVAESVDL